MPCLDPKHEYVLVKLPKFQPERFLGRSLAGLWLWFLTKFEIQAEISGQAFGDKRLRLKLA